MVRWASHRPAEGAGRGVVRIGDAGRAADAGITACLTVTEADGAPTGRRPARANCNDDYGGLDFDMKRPWDSPLLSLPARLRPLPSDQPRGWSWAGHVGG